VNTGDFIEIFCDAPISVCEMRDVKGLYQKARAGQIEEFTGISAPYQAPEHPELTVRTGANDLQVCVHQVVNAMKDHGIIARLGSHQNAILR
jgi:adenylylsulfate kinase